VPAGAGAGGLGGASALAASTNTVTKARAHKPAAKPSASKLASQAPAGPPRTSCKSVAHIGDSTSDGLVSHDYLPNWRLRINAQYEDVGVQTVYTNITGARSVVEVLPGTTNGYDAARQLHRQGFRGCWVLALGTNDTADVAVGSNVGLMTRIERMMAAAHGEPVMWVNVISLLSTGPYAEPNMRKWDQDLVSACAKYPNMRVLDWADQAKRPWFINDGIHYTSYGYAQRSRIIAQGLAAAFPLTGQSPGCVVQ